MPAARSTVRSPARPRRRTAYRCRRRRGPVVAPQDPDRVVAGIAVERIVAVRAGRVGARAVAAVEDVVAAAAVQDVVAGAAEDSLRWPSPVNLSSPLAADDVLDRDKIGSRQQGPDMRSGPPRPDVVTGRREINRIALSKLEKSAVSTPSPPSMISIGEVALVGRHQGVVVGAAIEVVDAEATFEPVVAVAAGERVGAAHAAEPVVGGVAEMLS